MKAEYVSLRRSLRNCVLAQQARNTLDSPTSIGHPARGPGFSDFDRAQNHGILFSRSELQAPISASSVDGREKRHSRSLPLVDASTQKTEEVADGKT